MLEAIRKRSAGIVIKGLLALLILSFALWGIADVFTRGGGNTDVATVGDIKITPDQVRRDFQRELERLSGMLGTRIDTEQARALGVVDSVLNRIIDRTLFNLAAHDQGVVVSDDLVRRDIANVPGFKNKNGEFDRARFQQTLESNRLSEAGFVALTRSDIVRAQYLSMIGAAPEAPKRLTEILFAYQNERRVAEILTIPNSSVTIFTDPTDTQLTKFHTENAARFTAPETRQLTYVSLTAGELAKEIAISEEEILATYNARKDEFQIPERRVLKQMRFKDQESAKKAYAMLKGGANFASVAKDIAGMDPDQLDLGAMTRAQLPPELAGPAFSMQPGDFSIPLKSVLGWHILGLTEIKPQTQQNLDEARKSISKELAAEKAINSLYHVANNLEDKLGGGATLEEAAKALNLPLKTIPAIDRTGFTTGNTRVNDLPKGDFLDVTFSTPEGQESPLTEAGSDGYFIVRVDSVTQPKLRPLASIRDEVVTAWKQKQQSLDVEKLAKGLVAKIKSGSKLDKLAKTLGLTVTTSTPFTRKSSVKDIPPGLVTTLFASPIGEALEAAGNGVHVVVRLKSVIAANSVAEKNKLVAMRQQLTSAIKANLLGQLASGLRQQYTVSINQAALNALF